MSVAFVPVTTDEEIHQLADMAGEIWREYWPAHIGAAQTEYLVQQFHPYEAICRGMQEQGYEYWFVEDEGRRVGYTGGYNEPETDRFFISKIYIYAHERGKHYASRIIEFYTQLCQERGLGAMYLTVNKHNEMGTRAYFAKGFEVIDSVETDIGEGFIMDDYIMEKKAI